MLPFLNGERVPALPLATASLHGLTADNLTRANLCRAVVEGTTFGLRYGLDLLRDSGIRSDGIRLIGGGAKSATWRQIVADIMGAPVTCPQHTEAAALGAAIQAAWCVSHQHGEALSLAALCERCVSLDDARGAEPDELRSRAYEGVYQRYREQVRALQ